MASHKNKVEKRKLLEIINRYENIVDSRKADPKTIAAKRRAWIQISNEFNRLPNIRPCTSIQIRRFWSNMKARGIRTQKQTEYGDWSSNSDKPECKDVHQFDSIDDTDNDDELNLDEFTYELRDTNGGGGERNAAVIIADSASNTKESRKPIAARISSACECIPDSKSTQLLNESSVQSNANQIDSVIKAQVTKLELSISHMKKLHQLAVQHEQLQIKLVEKQLEEQSTLHHFRLESEREIHEMRLKHEQELHLQRMHRERAQLLQREKADEHEVHGSYPIRYKTHSDNN